MYASVNYTNIISNNGLATSHYIKECWHIVDCIIEKKTMKFESKYINNKKKTAFQNFVY